jgi:hypothetical protein
MFDIIDELEFSDFKTDAVQDLNESLSRVEVLDLVVETMDTTEYFGESPTTLNVTAIYRLPLGAPQVVNFNVAVPGSLNEDTPI